MLTLKHVPQASKLTAIAFNDGLPPTAQWIFNDILAKEEK